MCSVRDFCCLSSCRNVTTPVMTLVFLARLSFGVLQRNRTGRASVAVEEDMYCEGLAGVIVEARNPRTCVCRFKPPAAGVQSMSGAPGARSTRVQGQEKIGVLASAEGVSPSSSAFFDRWGCSMYWVIPTSMGEGSLHSVFRFEHWSPETPGNVSPAPCASGSPVRLTQVNGQSSPRPAGPDALTVCVVAWRHEGPRAH